MNRRQAITPILCLGLCVVESVPAPVQAASGGFVLGPVGRYGTKAEEVVEGQRSVVGIFEGQGGYNQVLRSDPGAIRLAAGGTYSVRFRYRVLAAPDKGFEVLFFSQTGAWIDLGAFQSLRGEGRRYRRGLESVKLEAFDDYHVVWNIVGKGGLAIDSVEIRQENASIPVAEWGFEAPRHRVRSASFSRSGRR